MARKEPLYPHIPGGRKPPQYPHGSNESMNENGDREEKLKKLLSQITSTMQTKGRIHLIDIGNLAFAEGVDPEEVVYSLRKDPEVSFNEETGYFSWVHTPVYTGVLGFELWTKASERYGPDKTNDLSAKIDELLEASRKCILTDPNGVLDHYSDFMDILMEDEEGLEVESKELETFMALEDKVSEALLETLAQYCKCQFRDIGRKKVE